MGGGPDSTIRPPKAAEKNQFRRRRHRNLEKIRGFERKNGLFCQIGKIWQNSANFGGVGFHWAKFLEKLENFRKVWPDETPQAVEVAQKAIKRGVGVD